MQTITTFALLMFSPQMAGDFVDVGGITFYYNEFEGRPLGCFWPSLIYDCDSWDRRPWAAFPIEWYESGYYQCGDLVRVTFYDGSTMLVSALDACPGCLHSSIHDTGLPFVADLPKCWRQRTDGTLIKTATGSVENISAARRKLMNERTPSCY